MAQILIADDDAQIRLLLRRILEHAGHTIREASDGEEAARLARQNPPDLLITDLLMPNREGLETIMEFAAIAPRTKIIAISGGGCRNNLDFLSVAQKLGASRTVRKPFGPEDLLHAVGEVLGSIAEPE